MPKLNMANPQASSYMLDVVNFWKQQLPLAGLRLDGELHLPAGLEPGERRPAVITCSGYFLGSAIPSIGSRLDIVILGLLAVSVIPIAYEWWRHRREEVTS